MNPITGRITLVECLVDRADGFTRLSLDEHCAAHVVLLGHEATITIDGRAASFSDLVAWLVRPGGVSRGTFYPNATRYGAATRADFVSG